MNPKLSVTVQVDLDGRNVTVLVTGCLTEASQWALHPLIRRARTLTPGVRVTVDLNGAQHIEAAGIDLLRWTLDHDAPLPRQGPVTLVVPDPLPAHPVATARPVPAAPTRAAGTADLQEVSA